MLFIPRLRQSWPRISWLLPRLSLAALLLCLGSGLALTLQYQPFGDVFASLERLTSRAPYGFFLRRLHDVSGEVFVILALVHGLEHTLRHGELRMPAAQWLRLVPAMALCLLLLFTGFVLKADQEGRFAGEIMRRLLELFPVIGVHLSGIFVGQGGGFYYPVWLWHCWLLPLAGLWLVWGHVSIWIPARNLLLWSACGLGAYALLVPSPPAVPPGAMAETVLGPWFFLGLQELLHRLPAAFAGLLLPGVFMALTLALPFLHAPWRSGVRLLLGLCLICYIALSFGPLLR